MDCWNLKNVLLCDVLCGQFLAIWKLNLCWFVPPLLPIEPRLIMARRAPFIFPGYWELDKFCHAITTEVVTSRYWNVGKIVSNGHFMAVWKLHFPTIHLSMKTPHPYRRRKKGWYDRKEIIVLLWFWSRSLGVHVVFLGLWAKKRADGILMDFPTDVHRRSAFHARRTTMFISAL